MLNAGLCQRAGFPVSQLAQIHGTMFEVKCARNIQGRSDACAYTAPATKPIVPALTIPSDLDISDPNNNLPSVARAELPHCPLCNFPMRPAVVLFGESSPQRCHIQNMGLHVRGTNRLEARDWNKRGCFAGCNVHSHRAKCGRTGGLQLGGV